MAGSLQSLLALADDNVYRKNIGLQIYTLRNQLKADLKGTLKAVADAGYKQVEPYGFPGELEMVNVAKDLGLGVHSTHFDWEAAVNPSDDGYSDFVQEFGDEMMFEVDVFWIKAANLDPVSLIKGLSGRISQLHLKDIKKGINLPIYGGLPKDAFKELGNGMIPMEPIIEAAKAAGVAHCHVEQDQSPDPIASIKESMVYLKGL